MIDSFKLIIIHWFIFDLNKCLKKWMFQVFIISVDFKYMNFNRMIF
jgi:hypothetical protein